MERLFAAISAVAAIALIGVMGLRFGSNPMDERAHALENDLAKISMKEVIFETTPNYDFESLQKTIRKKPKLWMELVRPPPPPPKKIVKVPPPDLANMLLGVTPTRQQLKKKGQLMVLIKTPKDPRGNYHSVGDVIQGVTISKIDKTSVVFSMSRNGRTYTHSLRR